LNNLFLESNDETNWNNFKLYNPVELRHFIVETEYRCENLINPMIFFNGTINDDTFEPPCINMNPYYTNTNFMLLDVCNLLGVFFN